MFSLSLTVQLEYINHLLQFSKIFLIILALCLILLLTYYTGIIGWFLLSMHSYVVIHIDHTIAHPAVLQIIADPYVSCEENDHTIIVTWFTYMFLFFL